MKGSSSKVAIDFSKRGVNENVARDYLPNCALLERLDFLLSVFLMLKVIDHVFELFRMNSSFAQKRIPADDPSDQ